MTSPFTRSLLGQFETPPTTARLDGRQRSHRRQFTDSSKKQSIQAWRLHYAGSQLPSIVERGFTSDRYRLGAPPLQLLPLERREVRDERIIKIAIDEIMPKIERALEERNITTEDDHDSINLVYRMIPNDDEPSTDTLTLIIDAVWNDRSKEDWVLAVDSIRGMLLQNLTTSNIKVEMISWQAEAERILLPVEATDPLVQAWPSIRSGLHTILEQDSALNSDWKAIDVLRIGFETTPLPFPIVVSITVDWKLDSSD